MTQKKSLFGLIAAYFATGVGTFSLPLTVISKSDTNFEIEIDNQRYTVVGDTISPIEAGLANSEPPAPVSQVLAGNPSSGYEQPIGATVPTPSGVAPTSSTVAIPEAPAEDAQATSPYLQTPPVGRPEDIGSGSAGPVQNVPIDSTSLTPIPDSAAPATPQGESNGSFDTGNGDTVQNGGAEVARDAVTGEALDQSQLPKQVGTDPADTLAAEDDPTIAENPKFKFVMEKFGADDLVATGEQTANGEDVYNLLDENGGVVGSGTIDRLEELAKQK